MKGVQQDKCPEQDQSALTETRVFLEEVAETLRAMLGLMESLGEIATVDKKGCGVKGQRHRPLGSHIVRE
ncbi:MAG: hypothetical protein HY038_13900 [Nitrospirae bacterium]|jgi:hypothetical protein|nr:hypothetical protein [Nitrospirota bacterium]